MKRLPGPHNKIFQLYDVISEFITEEVKCHQKDMDRDNPRDYIDTFLLEMDKVREQLLCMYCILSINHLLMSLQMCFSTAQRWANGLHFEKHCFMLFGSTSGRDRDNCNHNALGSGFPRQIS